MSAAPFRFRNVFAGWNEFFFAPRDTRVCAAIRICYSVLLLLNMLLLLPDLELWFGEQGLVPYEASRSTIDSDTLTLFTYLPRTNGVVWACYGLLLTHIVLLLVGFWSRFQAVCVFIWLASFYHRNLMIFDGEDVVFRLVGFFLILLPIGDWHSLDGLIRRRRGKSLPPSEHPLWGLRLMQIELALIYLSTVWEKLRGEDWVTGNSLYYVSRLDDLFGHFPLPGFLFTNLTIIRLMTWSVLAFEMFIPFALWFKETRRLALGVALLFHVGTDYAMNLFLFHWIMLVGLLSFTEPDDYYAVRNLYSRVVQILGRIGNRRERSATVEIKPRAIVPVAPPESSVHGGVRG